MRGRTWGLEGASQRLWLDGIVLLSMRIHVL
jgi:hypothetical protein